jgi:hypothetical protein
VTTRTLTITSGLIALLASSTSVAAPTTTPATTSDAAAASASDVAPVRAPFDVVLAVEPCKDGSLLCGTTAHFHVRASTPDALATAKKATVALAGEAPAGAKSSGGPTETLSLNFEPIKVSYAASYTVTPSGGTVPVSVTLTDAQGRTMGTESCRVALRFGASCTTGSGAMITVTGGSIEMHGSSSVRIQDSGMLAQAYAPPNPGPGTTMVIAFALPVEGKRLAGRPATDIRGVALSVGSAASKPGATAELAATLPAPRSIAWGFTRSAKLALPAPAKDSPGWNFHVWVDAWGSRGSAPPTPSPTNPVGEVQFMKAQFGEILIDGVIWELE